MAEVEFYRYVAFPQERTYEAVRYLLDQERKRSVTVQFMPNSASDAQIEVIRVRDGELLATVRVLPDGMLGAVMVEAERREVGGAGR